MTTETTAPASIETDGITITAAGPGRYLARGHRVHGLVTAVLELEDRGTGVYVNGRQQAGPTPVVTTWFGSRSDRSVDPLTIAGIDYVGHYAMTAGGRYVGAHVARLDYGTPTQRARSIVHAIGAAVATLHATKANVNARKLADAEALVAKLEAQQTQLTADLSSARSALFVARTLANSPE